MLIIRAQNFFYFLEFIKLFLVCQTGNLLFLSGKFFYFWILHEFSSHIQVQKIVKRLFTDEQKSIKMILVQCGYLQEMSISTVCSILRLVISFLSR